MRWFSLSFWEGRGAKVGWEWYLHAPQGIAGKTHSTSLCCLVTNCRLGCPCRCLAHIGFKQGRGIRLPLAEMHVLITDICRCCRASLHESGALAGQQGGVYQPTGMRPRPAMASRAASSAWGSSSTDCTEWDPWARRQGKAASTFTHTPQSQPPNSHQPCLCTPSPSLRSFELDVPLLPEATTCMLAWPVKDNRHDERNAAPCTSATSWLH